MRRRRAPEAENHERWLVSYADFITLLFAFFVMMYANSKTDQVKAQQISESFQKAISEGRVSKALLRMVGVQGGGQPGTGGAESKRGESTAKAKEEKQRVVAVELLPSLRQLRESLKVEISAGRVDVLMEQRGLVISLREATFFPSGTDLIEPSTYQTLEIIARELKRSPNPIRMEGHTDSVPIRTERFPTNWHLASSRAIRMLEMFTGRYGIEPGRIAVSGFADLAPVAPNTTAEGRARNRRVDIVVLNEEAMRREPRQGQH